MKKTSLFLFGALVAIATLFTVGCQKQANNNSVIDPSIPPYLSKNNQIQQEIQFLIDNNYVAKDSIKKLVFITNSSEENDPMLWIYAIDGTDFGIIQRADIRELIDDTSSGSLYKHTYTGKMSKNGTLNVRILPSVSQGWKTAIIDACAYWNSKGYSVSFSPYSTNSNSTMTGEINVLAEGVKKADGTPNTNSFVWTLTPTINGGNPGKRVSINTNCIYQEPIISAKKLAMVHELGHALGFGHTDLLEAGVSWVSNNTITTTCKDDPDPSSVMKSTMSSYAAFNGFSTCDGQVFDYFY